MTSPTTEPRARGAEPGVRGGMIGVRDGLATLGPDALALRTALDMRFETWGHRAGAHSVAYPPLLAVDDLAGVDYFANFPHLGLLASGLAPEAVEAGYPGEGPLDAVPAGRLGPARHVLPPAACYSAYFDLAGERLDGPQRITTIASCFRREPHLDGLRRLYGFSMREIVCVGGHDDVVDHLARLKHVVLEFAAELGLPLTVETAGDPFFDPDGARAVSQRLFPVKEEFVFDGTPAVASVNFHRNFFGERCDIRAADGEPAYTGCVAFGLERWISALGDHFGLDPAELTERIVDVP
ncbi:aminoacyl--tRNA ligase-related protein [Spirillospora sp. CA-294931]|uniref:aminoacyl--tRNA ligase-related protein n=1 Tax=Spirillospora sp. CA-294931 TaxID=3240042 RepID=UPI003D8EA389